MPGLLAMKDTIVGQGAPRQVGAGLSALAGPPACQRRAQTMPLSLAHFFPRLGSFILHTLNLPVKGVFMILFFFIFMTGLTAQDDEVLGTQSRKAIKLYKEAEALVANRQFPEAISLFAQALDKDNGFAEAHFRIAACYKTLGDKEKAVYHWEKTISLKPDKKLFTGVYYSLAEYYFNKGIYEKAEKNMALWQYHHPGKSTSAKINKLKADIAFSVEGIRQPLDFKPQALPAPMNNFPLQYFPLLTADQQHMIFTGRLGHAPHADEDIYISTKDEQGSWMEPESIAENINSPINEGACTISANGRTLIFTSCQGRKGYGSCDLYISYKVGDTWTEPENMGEKINSSAWESQPSLSADGNTLYFVSNKKGSIGKRDIWVSSLDESGQWSTPVNLGEGINTKYDDISPFIHVNNQTLFFASKGYPGFGGYDLYYVEKEKGGWTKPVNVGYPINKHDDQVSLFISADGKTGYYSGELTDSLQQRSYIYQFEVPREIQVNNKSNYISGRVSDPLTNKPIRARINLFDINNEALVSTVYADSISGEYLIVLTEGSEYALYVDKEGYLFKSMYFDYSEAYESAPLNMDITLEPIKVGAKTTLKNIFFDFDRHDLKNKSKTELERIIEFMNRHPDLKIEISGHTDNVGTAAYNHTLSLKRAKAVYDYLVSGWIDAKRLIYKGYGHKLPIASNDTEAGRQRNRRIEISIVD